MITALQSIDAELLLAVQNMRSNGVGTLMQIYTSLGDAGALWVVLSGGLLCFKPTRQAGLLAIVSMLVGLICTNLVLKPLVARPRPWLSVPGLIPLIAEDDPNSFPSGHTCAAFAVAATLWRTLPEQWLAGKVAVIVLAVLMGLSRVYVGVHYPSDILAGAMVGSICSWSVWHAYLMRTSGT